LRNLRSKEDEEVKEKEISIQLIAYSL